MKKVFIVSKTIFIAGKDDSKKLFLHKKMDAYYWSYDIKAGSEFPSQKVAEQAIQELPADTFGKHFSVEEFFTLNGEKKEVRIQDSL